MNKDVVMHANAKDAQGNTFLHNAIRHNSIGSTEALLANKPALT